MYDAKAILRSRPVSSAYAEGAGNDVPEIEEPLRPSAINLGGRLDLLDTDVGVWSVELGVVPVDARVGAGWVRDGAFLDVGGRWLRHDEISVSTGGEEGVEIRAGRRRGKHTTTKTMLTRIAKGVFIIYQISSTPHKRLRKSFFFFFFFRW